MSASIVLDLVTFDAAIFDMDGTMIDNMAYHKKAWKEFLKAHKIELSDEEFGNKYSGKKNDVIFRDLFGPSLKDEEIQKLADEKEALYRKIYASHIKEIEGLSRLLDTLKKKGKQVAIATTAPEKNRAWGLSQLRLEKEFEVILGDEHVEKGKPDPEIYVKTATALHVLPTRCVVFEDSPPGVTSAKNADMFVVGILTTHTMQELAGADAFIENFLQVKIQ